MAGSPPLYKVLSLIILRQKLLPVAHIFSFKIMNYLKKFIAIKSLNTKQCAAKLSPSVKLSDFA